MSVWIWFGLGWVLGIYMGHRKVRHGVNRLIINIVEKTESILKKADGENNDKE